MDEIEVIPEEQARELMGEQIIAMLTEKWSHSFVQEKREWASHPKWPARGVKTKCTLFGVEYTILPEDIGLADLVWGEGFMETIQDQLERDLREIGAEHVYSYGFMD